MVRTFVIASGHFDPLHVGHLAYLKAARALGDHLTVIVNNDLQVRMKKGWPFMNESDRLQIVRSLACVTFAFSAYDVDPSVCLSLKTLHAAIHMPYGRGMPRARIIFANGGDVSGEECREASVCLELGIDCVFGVGGTLKLASSSALLERAGRLS